MTLMNNISQIISPDETTNENDYSNNTVSIKLKKQRSKQVKKNNTNIEEQNIKKPIQLYPYQIDHKNKLDNILKKTPFAFDFSMLGTGKTYTSSYIFSENLDDRFKHLVSIAPVSVKSKWKYMEKEHGINLTKSISYCELRSVKFKQPKHGLLIRRDYMKPVHHQDGTTTEKECVEYKCSKEYLKLVNEGVLLVIDEIQNIKNMSNQLDACQELMRPIIEGFYKKQVIPIQNQIYQLEKQIEDFKDKSCPTCIAKIKQVELLNERLAELINNPGNSRIILLSGSPIDKKKQVIHFYRALGIMESDRLSAVNPQTWSIIWKGMAEIEEYFIKNWGEEEVQKIKTRFIYGKPREYELEEYCYLLFNKIMKKHICCSMNPPPQTTQIYKRNAFYTLGVEHEVELLMKGVELLRKTTRFNQTTNTIDFGHDGMESLQGVIRALTMIETSKISLFVRIAQSALDENPNQKVVICVNYTDTINDLMELLIHYKPLRMDGSLSANQRGVVIDLFQQPNNEHRLLIGNLSVCSTGIDLDDQHGDYQRLCIVSPNYSTITLYQLSHRFQRANTKSNSTIHFVFCKESAELPILNALAKKSNVMKEVTDEQVEYGIVFPGDYEIWEDPDDINNISLTQTQIDKIKMAIEVKTN
jgi:hypothetical protein